MSLAVASLSEAERGTGGLACPICLGTLSGPDRGWSCAGCRRHYPIIAGIPDLRLHCDRYLNLSAERSKARRLAAIAAGTDLGGLAAAYYAMTGDVDTRRRTRYLGHIVAAVQRGEALSALIPERGRIL